MKVYYPGAIAVIALILILSSVTQRYRKQGKPVPIALRVGMIVLGIIFIALGILVIISSVKPK